MSQVDSLREQLGDSTKDMKLNLSTVLRGDKLAQNEAWGCALSAAYFVRHRDLVAALLADSAEILCDGEREDAKAAAAIMGMNTIYYRSRHMIGKEFYEQQRAGLRMNRMMKPESDRVRFELYSMACAALAGCDVCLKSHEESLLKEDVSQEKIHEVLRVAGVINGFAIGLDSEQG
ncbi:MAG: carboxymuconolactone decarboxylase family protein [Planctomycetota bacterium]|nr:carboxymuconolactone decarboxylase family protein [Planctomycetota bacterium]